MEVRSNTPLAALVYLSSICDGASSQDKAGFSGADVEFGHDLARKGERYGLSEKQHAFALRLSHKYRKQLSRAGFDPELIAAVVWGPGGRAPAAYVPPAERVNGWINRFAARCGCGGQVPVGAGKCEKIGGHWITFCAPCSDPALREPMVAIRVVGPNGEALA